MTLAPRFLVNFWAGLLATRFARGLRARGRADADQRAAYAHLVARLARAEYGRAAGIAADMPYARFRSSVPPRPTAFFKDHAERMGAGEPGVLWPGRCRFFVETAGTTGESLHLPVTGGMLAHYRAGLRDALLLYAARAGHAGVFLGRHVHTGPSTALTHINDVYTGGLDAMLALCLTPWVEANLYAPASPVTHLPDGPEKYAAIARTMSGRDVTLIGGLPSAVLGTIDAVRLAASRGQMKIPPLRALWPNLECFLHTGAPLGLFEEELRATLGPDVAFHELYAAAEGIIAAQDSGAGPGLRLLTGTGLFFEFLPVADYHPDRLAALGPQCRPLADVEAGVDYVLVLTTPAGLVRCVPGDVVRFLSVDPPRLVFAGRTALRLDAFGEGVDERLLTESLLAVCNGNDWNAVNFHVAPYHSRNAAGAARHCHEWWVELRPGTVKTPMGAILAGMLDTELICRVPAYAARRRAGTLEAPVVRLVMPGLFGHWAHGAATVGSASKMPRCRPDRLIADQLAEIARFATTEAPFGVKPSTTHRPFTPAPLPTAPGSVPNPLQVSREPFRS
ncbi:MAG TPA: GH3 auxin-responsive promoter family protein [Opitutaceae bacterium]|nr:GH3 auxin-responsive promoter family protein [Opitutaceae bacterium]